jgi:hypothetical protein
MAKNRYLRGRPFSQIKKSIVGSSLHPSFSCKTLYGWFVPEGSIGEHAIKLPSSALALMELGG